eukprot:10994841-Lingulodinium_polyedra.AAC.1
MPVHASPRCHRLPHAVQVRTHAAPASVRRVVQSRAQAARGGGCGCGLDEHLCLRTAWSHGAG